MRELTNKQNELLDILARRGYYTIDDLSSELNVKKECVRSLIASLRRRFLFTNTENLPYIFTTKLGYTIEEKPEHAAYEARRRLQQGFGILVNGVYVFRKCKQLAHTQFNALNIEFKPKMITLQKLIK